MNELLFFPLTSKSSDPDYKTIANGPSRLVLLLVRHGCHPHRPEQTGSLQRRIGTPRVDHSPGTALRSRQGGYRRSGGLSHVLTTSTRRSLRPSFTHCVISSSYGVVHTPPAYCPLT